MALGGSATTVGTGRTAGGGFPTPPVIGEPVWSSVVYPTHVVRFPGDSLRAECGGASGRCPCESNSSPVPAGTAAGVRPAARLRLVADGFPPVTGTRAEKRRTRYPHRVPDARGDGHAGHRVH